MGESIEPSNAVLMAKIEALAQVVTINQVQSHESQTAILAQCVKTNGRVNSLENWRSMIIGGLLLTNIIIVPTAITLFIKYLLR